MSSSALTNTDKKHWAPIDSVVKWLADQIPSDAKVLEIGPGFVPFPKANFFVDYRDLPHIHKDQKVSIDLNRSQLPFADKTFDFVYCRHVIEDMTNPFLLLSEMERVAKAGYIETPSPSAEMVRGIDGASPPFRGYHHHHFVVWVHENQLRLVSKYPFVEYLRFTEEDIVNTLREDKKFWNTHYLWKDKIDWVYRQNGYDYIIMRDYAPMLKDAMDQSRIASGMFWIPIPSKVEIEQSALPQFALAQS